MSVTLTFLTAIHLIVALVLIVFVLLQDPKGGGAMGVFGGGGSNSLFGSTGANNFLTQVTKGSAILFAILCVALTYLISHPGKSVLDVTAPASPSSPSSTAGSASPESQPTPKADEKATKKEVETNK